MDDSMFTIQEMYANLLTAYGKASLRIRQLEAAVAALIDAYDEARALQQKCGFDIAQEAMQDVK